MKIKIYKDYIEEEIKKVEKDKFLNRSNRFRENLIILMLIIIGALCVFTPVYCNENINQRYNFNIQAFPRIFPNTWDCKKCGYSHYEGIDKCTICGTHRYY